MKFNTLFFLYIFLASQTMAATCEPIRIAVVDTGLDITDLRFKDHLCATGHKNFVLKETLDDVNGHGTFVTSLIEQNAGEGNYCILIYKYYSESDTGAVNLKRELLAFKEAIDNKADIINFSSSGDGFDEKESLAIKDHPDVTFVIAAGNDSRDLDIPGNETYPASFFYKNMEVVGGIDKDGNRVPTSNYSKKIVDKELGVEVKSDLPNNTTGQQTGTSFATAIFSGKLVAKSLKTCKYRSSDASQY